MTKLMHCLSCDDWVALQERLKKCECGQCAGRYLDDHLTVIVTREAEVYSCPNQFITLNLYDEDVIRTDEGIMKWLRQSQRC